MRKKLLANAAGSGPDAASVPILLALQGLKLDSGASGLSKVKS